MDKQELLQRLEDLELSLDGDNTDDDTRADILDEIAEIESELEELETA